MPYLPPRCQHAPYNIQLAGKSPHVPQVIGRDIISITSLPCSSPQNASTCHTLLDGLSWHVPLDGISLALPPCLVYLQKLARTTPLNKTSIGLASMSCSSQLRPARAGRSLHVPQAVGRDIVPRVMGRDVTGLSLPRCLAHPKTPADATRYSVGSIGRDIVPRVIGRDVTGLTSLPCSSQDAN